MYGFICPRALKFLYCILRVLFTWMCSGWSWIYEASLLEYRRHLMLISPKSVTILKFKISRLSTLKGHFSAFSSASIVNDISQPSNVSPHQFGLFSICRNHHNFFSFQGCHQCHRQGSLFTPSWIFSVQIFQATLPHQGLVLVMQVSMKYLWAILLFLKKTFKRWKVYWIFGVQVLRYRCWISIIVLLLIPVFLLF